MYQLPQNNLEDTDNEEGENPGRTDTGDHAPVWDMDVVFVDMNMLFLGVRHISPRTLN